MGAYARPLMTTGSVRQLIPSVISPPQWEQMAMALLCSTLSPIISGSCDTGADTEATPVLTCAHDDCEERRGPCDPGGVVVGQGLRGVRRGPRIGPAGCQGPGLTRGGPRVGGAAAVHSRRRSRG